MLINFIFSSHLDYQSKLCFNVRYLLKCFYFYNACYNKAYNFEQRHIRPAFKLNSYCFLFINTRYTFSSVDFLKQIVSCSRRCYNNNFANNLTNDRKLRYVAPGKCSRDRTQSIRTEERSRNHSLNSERYHQQRYP